MSKEVWAMHIFSTGIIALIVYIGYLVLTELEDIKRLLLILANELRDLEGDDNNV